MVFYSSLHEHLADRKRKGRNLWLLFKKSNRLDQDERKNNKEVFLVALGSGILAGMMKR